MRRFRIGLTALLLLIVCAGFAAAQEIDYLPGAESRVGRYVFLVDDVNDPLPDTGITADDLLRRGFLLFDSPAALHARAGSAACWVGSIGIANRLIDTRNNFRVPDGASVLHITTDMQALFEWSRNGYSRSEVWWPVLGEQSIPEQLLEAIDDWLESYPCSHTAAERLYIAAQRAEGEAFLEQLSAGRAPRQGSGGLLLVEDIEQPIFGAPYTAEDFAAAGFRLTTSLSTLARWADEQMPCVIGFIGSGAEFELLLDHPMLYLLLISDQVNFMYIEPSTAEFAYGSMLQFLTISEEPGKAPSLEVAPGAWRSLTSLMEGMGCSPATEDSETATGGPVADQPTASGSLRWEYKVVSLGEELIDLFFESVFSFALFAMEMESMVDEIDPYAAPNALLEYVLPEVIELIIDSMDYAAGSFESKLNEYGAQGWELVSVQDGMAYFKRQMP